MFVGAAISMAVLNAASILQRHGNESNTVLVDINNQSYIDRRVMVKNHIMIPTDIASVVCQSYLRTSPFIHQFKLSHSCSYFMSIVFLLHKQSYDGAQREMCEYASNFCGC